MTSIATLLAWVMVDILFTVNVSHLEAQESNVNKAIEIGSRLELMVDDFKSSGASSGNRNQIWEHYKASPCAFDL